LTEPATTTTAEFRLLRTLRQSLALLKRRPGFYIGVSIIPVLPSLLVMIRIIHRETFVPKLITPLTWQFGFWFLFMVLRSVVWAVIASAVFADLHHENVSSRAPVVQTGRRPVAILLLILPVAGVWLYAMTMMQSLLNYVQHLWRFPVASLWFLNVASIVFASPEFVAMVVLGTAIPVCIIEKRGPVSSLWRSWNLSRGHRLAVLGVWLMMFIASRILTAVLTYIILAQLFHPAVRGFSNVLFHSVVVVVTGILGATLYSNLRAATETAGPSEIATVFD